MKQIKSYLIKLELWMLLLFLGSMILLSFSQIIFRKIFSNSIPHADQIVTMLVMYIALIGGALATLEDKHINIEILSKFVSVRINKMMGLLVNAFAVFMMIVLFDASIEYIELQQDNIEFFFPSVKTIRVESFILPGFLLMGIGFLLNFIEHLLFFIHKKEAE